MTTALITARRCDAVELVEKLQKKEKETHEARAALQSERDENSAKDACIAKLQAIVLAAGLSTV
jgi:hypothetical protein